ncbi:MULTISPECIES: DsbA family protein [Haloarcula]|uniref:Thioredoxin domain-containing protein n=1 Tax=Haloarcula pellucida TaxID=1427151 RepID=A0A830GHE7_9EURY|nr:MULTISPECIES: thioredoxin domain-containing protein [Halomicroarcula]MBX0347580.1 DsbA family protein [Halomicroarcula pellucida]MDS0276498.1 DsbA family protein [Halomicroarcula sp. S1AR25-4]GGN89391.1 hypothetical protein GCM10009030_10070 [Halomicroarcula pellucida]
MTRLSRRGFLAGSVALTGATAGCLSGGSGESGDDGSDDRSVPTASGQPLSAPVAGNPDADVTVAAYEDYACPHCKTYSQTVFPKVQENFLADGTVRYEFHDFPIPVDETVSWQAANAARKVQDAAGDAAYFTYSKRLFENQSRLGPDVYAELTDGLDVGGDAVRKAATDRTYDPTVQADRDRAVEKGLRGTPTVLVNDQPVEWQEIAYAPVRDAIQSALNG